MYLIISIFSYIKKKLGFQNLPQKSLITIVFIIFFIAFFINILRLIFEIYIIDKFKEEEEITKPTIFVNCFEHKKWDSSNIFYIENRDDKVNSIIEKITNIMEEKNFNHCDVVIVPDYEVFSLFSLLKIFFTKKKIINLKLFFDKKIVIISFLFSCLILSGFFFIILYYLEKNKFFTCISALSFSLVVLFNIFIEFFKIENFNKDEEIRKPTIFINCFPEKASEKDNIFHIETKEKNSNNEVLNNNEILFKIKDILKGHRFPSWDIIITHKSITLISLEKYFSYFNKKTIEEELNIKVYKSFLRKIFVICFFVFFLIIIILSITFYKNN